MSAAHRALVVVDVQRDFCEGGSLAVEAGAEVAARISELLRRYGQDYHLIVATRDYHVDPGSHFAAEPDYRDTWPPHCVAGTPGADFHPDLDTGPIQAVFDKGAHAAAYSGLEGTDERGVGLADYLRQRGVAGVDVVGIATDYCVRATALDSVREGFATRVLRDLCAGVAEHTTAGALAELAERGVTIASSPLLADTTTETDGTGTSREACSGDRGGNGRL